MLSIIANNKVYKEDVTKWQDFPEPIDRMEYKISSTKYIVFEGFDSYLRIQEMYKGVNYNVEGVSKVFLFGRALGKTAVVEINIKKGTISNYIVPKGREYDGKLQAEGHWKKGLGGVSKIYVKEV